MSLIFLQSHLVTRHNKSNKLRYEDRTGHCNFVDQIRKERGSFTEEKNRNHQEFLKKFESEPNYKAFAITTSQDSQDDLFLFA